MQFETICTGKMPQASGIQATRAAITLRTRNKYNEKNTTFDQKLHGDSSVMDL